MKHISTKLYIITFFITVIVFGVAISVSNYITQRKTEELKAVEDKVTIDILILESELDALKATSCESLTTTTLRSEMANLNDRLSFMESQVGADNPDVFRLKRYYSLLEIRDYQLTKQAATECKRNDILILYFYSQKNCSMCSTEGYIMQAIQDRYSRVKVYGFDYNFDLPAVETSLNLKNVPGYYPAIYVNGKYYPAFSNLTDLETVLQPYLSATTTATSTESKSKILKH